jgi:transketolase
VSAVDAQSRLSTARVSIEAGVTMGWDRFVGDRGIAIGVDKYGASAPDKVLYEQYGLTAAEVVEAAKSLV